MLVSVWPKETFALKLDISEDEFSVHSLLARFGPGMECGNFTLVMSRDAWCKLVDMLEKHGIVTTTQIFTEIK